MTNAIQEFERTLQRHRRNGLPFLYRHARTSEIRAVIIREIEPDQIHVESAAVPIERQGRTLFALRYNPIAVENYKWMGIRFSAQSTTIVKKKFIQLLSPEEGRAFHEKQVLLIETKFNVSNKSTRDQHFFEEIVPKLVPGIAACQYHSEFRKKNGIPQVLLEILHHPTVRRGELIKTIESTLEGKLYSTVSL